MGSTGEGEAWDTRGRKDSAKSMVVYAAEGKRGSAGSGGGHDGQSPRVNRKFIENWRHACDRTKDRTKELLKKWRTLPEPDAEVDNIEEEDGKGWSEHVWATWVNRSPHEDESTEPDQIPLQLTNIQKDKLANFFIQLLDMDSDDVISLCDFENLFERLRHFADWSTNSAEYHRLLEVQRGFVEYFLLPADMVDEFYSYDALEKAIRMNQLELDEWLHKWSAMLSKADNFLQLPLWLQYFPILLFQIINKSGNGCISKGELSAFYTSVVGLSEQQVSKVTPNVYNILTSNEEHKLDAHVYRLSFANLIFGRYPNGPGHWLLSPLTHAEPAFPIDYKAMNCAPQDLEQYSPKVKTDRRSVIV